MVGAVPPRFHTQKKSGQAPLGARPPFHQVIHGPPRQRMTSTISISKSRIAARSGFLLS
jgi:hypothetical protein